MQHPYRKRNHARDDETPIFIPTDNVYYDVLVINHDIFFGPDERPEDRKYPKLSNGDDLARRIHDASYGAILVGLAPNQRFFGEDIDHFLETSYTSLSAIVKELAPEIIMRQETRRKREEEARQARYQTK